MKKKRVKEKLYEIRVAIIDEIEEPTKAMKQFLFNHQDVNMEYGYKVGMSHAAMILLDKIYELFPEENYED